MADRIAVMHDGVIVQVGSPEEVYNRPASRFVADFIGEANLITCKIIDLTGNQATIDIEGFQHTLPSRGLSLGPATLAVRPSRIVIGEDVGIAARITKATYVGVRMEYTLEGAFGQVFAVQDNVDEPLEVGTDTTMSFASKGPVLLPE